MQHKKNSNSNARLHETIQQCPTYINITIWTVIKLLIKFNVYKAAGPNDITKQLIKFNIHKHLSLKNMQLIRNNINTILKGL